MIQIGRTQRLPVWENQPEGLYLGDAEEHVLLPRRLAPHGYVEGDWIEVFVYTDSEDLPVATTQTPLAEVGQFACLQVVDVTRHGAFLDWGLPKDLFAPFGRQHRPMRRGDWVVVGLSLHTRTGRVIASSTLKGLFDDDVAWLQPGDPVSLMVYGFNDRGVQVIVEGRHAGLIFRDRVFQRVRIGEELQGFVHQIREDHRLDISLQRGGRAGNVDAEAVILAALDDAGGSLPLHDKSPPQAIRDALGLSKKAFKRAVGSLYKDQVITLSESGIHRVD